MVRGGVPSETSTSRSSRVSAADNASDMARTMSAMTTTIARMICCTVSGEMSVRRGPDQSSSVMSSGARFGAPFTPNMIDGASASIDAR